MTSVCLSDRHADSLVVYAWIDVGLGLCSYSVYSCGIWHVNACFKKF